MFLQWFNNLKWIRAIREHDSLVEQVTALEKERDELEVALMAKAATHSAMDRVLKGIDQRVNSTGYRRNPPTLRRRPGESDNDLMKRYDDATNCCSHPNRKYATGGCTCCWYCEDCKMKGCDNRA